MKKIKVLHTVNWFGNGGMERGVLKLMNGLDRRYFQPYLAALRGIDADVQDQLLRDVFVISINKKPGRDFSVVAKLAAFIRENDIDVVHSHNWGSWLYSQAAARRAGVAVYIHGEHGRDTEKLDDGFLKRLFKIGLASQVRQFTTVSQDIAQLLNKEWLVNKRKICVIENGIDLERFRPIEKNKAKKSLELECDILFGAVIGSFRPVKDLPTFFRALALVNKKYQNWKLAIVGGKVDDSGDDYAQMLKKMVHELNLSDNIIFLGPRKNVSYYMQAFDVYVNSSVYEGMSNTILEAMGCETAVVATNVGGTPNIIEHQRTGLLVPYKSPTAMADALLQMIDQPALRRRLAENGRQCVEEHHSQIQFIGRHEMLYKQLLSANRRRAFFPSRGGEKRTFAHNQAGVK